MTTTTRLPERLHIIDALRGFTLLGIILAHMLEQYNGGMLPEKIASQNTSALDMIFSALVSILVSGKFFMIFSFLFGMSFYLQLSKGKGDLSFLAKFAWRLILLFAIGMIHHLHYRGDILTIYALLGFGLLITYKLPVKYILISGLVLTIDLPGILTRVVQLAIHDTDINGVLNQDQSVLMHYYDTFKSGSYLQLLKENLNSFLLKMEFQVWSGRIYITMGMFLLGYYAGTKRLFEQLPESLPQFKRYLKLAAWSLLAIFLFGIGFFLVSNMIIQGGLPKDANIAAGVSIMNIFNACLTIIYIAWFAILFQREKWQKRLMIFYEAGRMGLTTYILQSAFGLTLLSTLGFGLVGEFGAAILFLLAIGFFAIQIALSKFWLTYFNYGPIEWGWRCLTNFTWVPLAKATSSNLEVRSE